MKTIDKEIVEESERPTQIDGVSAHRTISKVVVEATEDSEYGITGEQYSLRAYEYIVTDCAERVLEINDWRHSSSRYHAWLGLLERTAGKLQISGQKDFVPVKIAVLGKPELVAYLYVVHELEWEEIGEIVGVTVQTVKQYLKDVSRGRRKKN